MKIRIFILAAMPLLFLANFLYAYSIVEIADTQIPLIEGAKIIKSEEADINKILGYSVNRPRDEVIGFYQAYFKENGFSVIGGREEDGFNVSVKKDRAMFTLRIYSKDNQTIIQFIW